MRLTIIPQDKFIRIDDVMLGNIQEDLSWIPSDVHAVQWYDTWGEVEYNGNSPNTRIEELGIYEQAIQILQDEIERRKEEIESSRDYWYEFRFIRNDKLSNTDWTQVPDSPLTEEQKENWRIYRQQLRDLPDIITDPKPFVNDEFGPLWPQEP